MAYDPDQERAEQNRHHAEQQQRTRLELESRDRTDAVFADSRNHDLSIIKTSFDMPLADVASTDAPVTPSPGGQFLGHLNLLINHLDSLWEGTFPVHLITQWLGQIALLDIENTAQSLESALALRDSFRQARVLHTPPHQDIARVTRFETQVSRVGDEIEWLIDILWLMMPPDSSL